MSGKIFGIISIKGGVGKTTTVSNLGAALAARGKKVLLVDANFSAPNLGLQLGMLNTKPTLHDVMKNRADVPKAIYSTDYGFDIMPASLSSGKINPFQLKRKISYLRNHYDMILLDSSPALNDEMLSTIMASDELLVVSSPDYPTLSCTMNAVKTAKKKNVPITGIILNRVYNKKFELTLADIEDAADTPVLSVIPHDVKVPESIAYTRPVLHHSPNSDVVNAYNKLAAALIGEQYEDKRLWTKVRNFFWSEDETFDSINRNALMRAVARKTRRKKK